MPFPVFLAGRVCANNDRYSSSSSDDDDDDDDDDVCGQSQSKVKRGVLTLVGGISCYKKITGVIIIIKSCELV